MASDPREPIGWLTPRDPVSLAMLASHVLVFGATGSGKTSGVLAWLLQACLRARASVVLTCAKPDDAARYAAIVALSGRTDVQRLDLATTRFNPLA
jgi:type IV secretory pathway TraG/TraD family ATPase VirD4